MNAAQLQEGTIALLYEVVGRGTHLLSHLQPGDEVDPLGPLGRGFTLVPGRRLGFLVGGGMGLAPPPFSRPEAARGWTKAGGAGRL